MKTLGEKVRDAREARGWSQDRLAKEAGTSQTTVDNIERGATKRSRYLLEVLSALGLPVNEVDASLTKPTASPIVRNILSDETAQLPIYASAEGGEGQMVTNFNAIDYMVAPEPLRNVSGAFGIYVTGDSMEPRFFQGDLALIHPHRPARPGDDVLLTRVVEGTTYCMIKRLRGSTPRLWRLTQFNPPEGAEKHFDLPRADWPQCLSVVGHLIR